MARYVKGISDNFMGVFATVASLPTVTSRPPAERGDIAFAMNALKASETTGNGTGNLVFFDGTNWIRVDTGATAAA